MYYSNHLKQCLADSELDDLKPFSPSWKYLLLLNCYCYKSLFHIDNLIIYLCSISYNFSFSRQSNDLEQMKLENKLLLCCSLTSKKVSQWNWMQQSFQQEMSVINLPGVEVALELSFCTTFTFTYCFANTMHLLSFKNIKVCLKRVEWFEFWRWFALQCEHLSAHV